MRGWVVGVCGLVMACAGASAQMAERSGPGADEHGYQSLQEQGKALLAQAAKSPNGIATAQLERYAGHFDSLTARTKSGGGEVHRRWNDVFVVVDGEATVLTGGHVVDPRDTVADEQRGTRVEGGEAHVLRRGDVLHISTNTPHQTVVAPGKTFVYYVVKVEDPGWKAAAAK